MKRDFAPPPQFWTFTHSIRHILTCASLILASLFSFSQQLTISGSVLDENQKPFLGVSVAEKGTSNGVITDFDGKFKINLKKVDAILEFSYLGYENTVAKAADGMSITMGLRLEGLGEVVVVGYESQNKREVSSAVVKVTAAMVNKRVSNTPDQLLQGRLPGLQVRQNTGEPGNSGTSLIIRGPGTFSGAGNNPLIVIDGLPGSMSSLNPNDIENITVLKDAASAAIYGSRGANGVIVITTKSGSGDRFSVSVDSNVSFQTPTALPNVITNSAQYMQLRNEAMRNTGQVPFYTKAQIDLFSDPNRDRNLYPDYNWLNAIMTNPIVQNHYLSISGNKNKTGYNVSFGYANQPGVMRGFDYEKYTVKFNLNSQLNDFIKLSTYNILTYSERKSPVNGGADQFLSALAAIPMTLPEGQDRRFFTSNLSGVQGFGLGNKNPVAMYKHAFQFNDVLQGQTNIGLDIRLWKGLSLENKGGVNFTYYNENAFRPDVPLYDQQSGKLVRSLITGGGPAGSLDVSANRTITTSLYTQLKYDEVFADVHKVSAYAGRQQDTYYTEGLSAYRQGYAQGDTRRQIDVGEDAATKSNGGTAYAWSLVGYYGHAKYVYHDRYIIDGNVRYDGSSRFSNETRWGLFYSGSAAWRISAEPFMPKVDWLNDLKFRTSYGELGNQNINRPSNSGQPYLYQTFLTQGNYAFVDTTQVGYYQGFITNRNITWEKTSMMNFALEGAFFNNRLSLSIDYYIKNTSGILREAQIPGYFGMGAPIINDGEMVNRGMEIQATYNGQIGKDFKYSITANVDGYRNELVKYSGSGGNLNNTTFNKVGQPYNTFYLYEAQGIFQSQQEAEAAPDQTSVGFKNTEGFLRLRDLNNDGKIDLNDRTFMGGRYPLFNYSLNLSTSYKNFDLTVFLYGSQGQKMYLTGHGAEPYRQGSAPTTYWLNRWTPENRSTTIPKMYDADASNGVSSYRSTFFLRDASFLRIKNINVGYTFDSLIRKLSLLNNSRLRVYLSMDNVFTFTGIEGLDPERTGVSGNFVIYPQVTSYAVGLQFTF